MARKLSGMVYSGPFFAHDPAKTFRQNARVMLKAIADEAAADIAVQFRSGSEGRAEIAVGGGRVASEVEGYVRGVRSGRPWALTARVHIKNTGLTKARAVSLHAAGSRLEGRIHAFRKTTSAMRRAKAINRAELLKGIQ